MGEEGGGGGVGACKHMYGRVRGRESGACCLLGRVNIATTTLLLILESRLRFLLVFWVNVGVGVEGGCV